MVRENSMYKKVIKFQIDYDSLIICVNKNN